MPGSTLNSFEDSLPRIAYVGDVPVEASYHGSLLLYRLLQNYPVDKLLVIEASRFPSLPPRRLKNVQYRHWREGAQDWLNTRFGRLAASWLTLAVAPKSRRLRRMLDQFEPEAVLTVAHGYSWMAAGVFAGTKNVPLHLIVHDAWPACFSVYPWLELRLNRYFRQIYCNAASRLCISPFMEEEYRRKYGVSGHVLYPLRALDCPTFNEPAATGRKTAGPLVGAYAGNIFSEGYARLIQGLAHCLQERGGTLLLFGPHSPDSISRWGLDRSNISLQGFVNSGELIARMRSEADFVFLPMSFDADGEQLNMRLAFPSKLTDYTATDLPLLIWGPSYCSAVRWAQDYAPVAELVTSPGIEGVREAIVRLESREHRLRLGHMAMNAGNALFSHKVVTDVLTGHLRQSVSHQNRQRCWHESISIDPC